MIFVQPTIEFLVRTATCLVNSNKIVVILTRKGLFYHSAIASKLNANFFVKVAIINV